MQEILRAGDLALYLPQFQQAVVTVRPGTLRGSGRFSAVGSLVCVRGDETSALVPGCAYLSGAFTVPGVGILSILTLGADQVAKVTRSAGRPLLLKGSTFRARFQVVTPAQMPPPASTPDPTPIYLGSGRFETTNKTVLVGR